MTAEFQHPETHLLQADVRTVANLLSAAADLTLVVDYNDVIDDLSHNLDQLSSAGIPSWRGQPIEGVVRSSSRSTLKKMLRTARDGGSATRFDISHLLDGGRDLPIQYSAFKVGGDGQIVLLGRDLRVVAELQSRLLANRQSLEQNAKNQRQAEAHYRLLFETASEAIIIVDAASGKIREANPRAAAIVGFAGAGLSGRRLSALFDKHQQADVQAMLAAVLASGTPVTLSLSDGPNDRRLVLAAELFRAGDLRLIMVRVSEPDSAADLHAAPDLGLDSLVRNAAEGVLLTDDQGKVLWANESFLALAGLPLAAHAVGRSFGDFFEWSNIEQDVLLQNVRRHGRVQTFAGTVKGMNGQSTDVDLSAVAMLDRSPPGYGFVIRALSTEGARPGRGNSDLTRTAENLVEMIGRVPMKDLVRDTTDVIEKMCIEAALNLTGNNRASAARVLGLSRQALYLKMNKFGIASDEE
ncbi:transcriptional regulator PpsR [Mesorhizobium loti R88b]|uniref:Transcriptional regulator PpsR n=2 Tax=Rhizobium loti TaxID=381 RepID=A0A6M7WTC5_RHILI|nr:transcriptional regulator PpsR [Mesorhizobium loti R88b]